MKKTYSKINSIKPAGKSKVYDFTVKDTHRILANNFYTSNCHINHPDIVDFIMKKDDLTKVTGANVSVKVTDEFMEAVERNEDFHLAWPIQKKQPEIREQIPYNSIHILEDGTHVRRVKAREVWNTIVNQAHKNAEPGVLFWDNVIKESPADMYGDLGFKTLGTNPCVTGDTLVSVADGRGEVRIDQLEKEDKDVPVYTLNDNGNVEIQIMRNPRITGYNEKIYKVIFDSGDSVRVTGNHKIRLKDGNYIEAKDLKYGDSVHTSTITYSPILSKNRTRSKNYKFINAGSKLGRGKSEHRLIYEFNNEKISENWVIHHKDYNTLNNHISNLEGMTKEDHDQLHIEDMLGDKNPYHRMTDEWKFNFASHKGESNGRFSGISNFNLYKEILRKTKEEGRRLSKKEWKAHAIKLNKENTENHLNYPEVLYSEFRGGTYTYLLERAANFLGLEFVDKDPRLVRTYFKACANSYEAKIENNRVMVKKSCEHCQTEFWQEYGRREISFCSHTCANIYLNKNIDINERRTDTINSTYSKKAEINKENQLRIYSQLKFDLDRDLLIAEWREKCKKEDVPSRIGTKNGFSKWTEVKELAEDYNHKVVSVELDGVENVYNGTVDKWHNFFTVLKPFNQINQHKQFIINNLNCGEIPLSPFDSCRLGSINIFTLVEDPFTKEAQFRWDKLAKNARLAQRFMDDIVDLEEEKVDRIIKKIKSDPEDSEIKRAELMTWKKVLEVLKKGRRTGVGMLGVGDALAAMNLKFGTPEATKFVENIAKCIAINSYRETVNLAKERGHFPIWDADKEAPNPFIRRIISENFDNKEYKEYLDSGRRNIATLSIAPTGSLAILAQTTSGIEPVFKIYYRRRRKVNPGEGEIKVDFIDENGDSWEEYNVIHPPFINWYCQNINGDLDTDFKACHQRLKEMSEGDLDSLVDQSPWKGSESHDIDYMEKVRMQGAIQKWVDHSISVTHNLPEKITVPEVNDIYFEGWKAGCKGLTIYREGSRQGVLLTKRDEEGGFKETQAPKRGKELEADYYVAKAKGREFAVIIGLKEGKPYEVFAFENPPMNKNTRGKIIKLKKGHYKFINGEFEIPDIQLAAERVEERTLTLSASMLLRHGAPIPHVINVVKKIDDNVTSFSSVVRRYLSRYIPEELDAEACPVCGDKLIMQDGCVKCVNPECGYSRCG